MKTLITICARGGSKGIPGKNIRLMNNIPLIGYSIKVAKQFAEKNDAEIALSTDSIEIRDTAAKFGLLTDYLRPNDLANDTVGKLDAIADVLNYYEKLNNEHYDFILDLDVTSPLRTFNDLQSAFVILKEQEDAWNVFSVSPANRNPYFNMVEKTNKGFVKLVKEKKIIKSRQEAPLVYDMNASFYIYRRSFFNKGFQTAITEKSLAYVVPHLCFDLDHPHDFTIMEFIKENLIGIEI